MQHILTSCYMHSTPTKAAGRSARGRDRARCAAPGGRTGKLRQAREEGRQPGPLDDEHAARVEPAAAADHVGRGAGRQRGRAPRREAAHQRAVQVQHHRQPPAVRRRLRAPPAPPSESRDGGCWRGAKRPHRCQRTARGQLRRMRRRSAGRLACLQYTPRHLQPSRSQAVTGRARLRTPGHAGASNGGYAASERRRPVEAAAPARRLPAGAARRAPRQCPRPAGAPPPPPPWPSPAGCLLTLRKASLSLTIYESVRMRLVGRAHRRSKCNGGSGLPCPRTFTRSQLHKEGSQSSSAWVRPAAINPQQHVRVRRALRLRRPRGLHDV